MKKLIVLLLVTGVMTLGFSTISFAQDAEEEAQDDDDAYSGPADGEGRLPLACPGAAW